ncbi:MAG: hypothetical protein ACRAVC_11330 [Trichormus sp.]
MKTNENQKTTSHQPGTQKPFFGARHEHTFFSSQREEYTPFFQPQADSPSAIHMMGAKALQKQTAQNNVIQRMSANQYGAVRQWHQSKGLSVWDYGYNPNSDLIIYLAEVPAVGTVEIHVHLAHIKNGRVTGSNIRLRNEAQAGSIDITASEIQATVLKFWFPDINRLQERQGSDHL